MSFDFSDFSRRDMKIASLQNFMVNIRYGPQGESWPYGVPAVTWAKRGSLYDIHINLPEHSIWRP